MSFSLRVFSFLVFNKSIERFVQPPKFIPCTAPWKGNGKVFERNRVNKSLYLSVCSADKPSELPHLAYKNEKGDACRVIVIGPKCKVGSYARYNHEEETAYKNPNGKVLKGHAFPFGGTKLPV